MFMEQYYNTVNTCKVFWGFQSLGIVLVCSTLYIKITVLFLKDQVTQIQETRGAFLKDRVTKFQETL